MKIEPIDSHCFYGLMFWTLSFIFITWNTNSQYIVTSIYQNWYKVGPVGYCIRGGLEVKWEEGSCQDYISHEAYFPLASGANAEDIVSPRHVLEEPWGRESVLTLADCLWTAGCVLWRDQGSLGDILIVFVILLAFIILLLAFKGCARVYLAQAEKYWNVYMFNLKCLTERSQESTFQCPPPAQ